MKRNVALLPDQVRNKLTGKCVSAIVTEAFINALPFDKSALASEATSLSQYSARVIGIHILRRINGEEGGGTIYFISNFTSW